MKRQRNVPQSTEQNFEKEQNGDKLSTRYRVTDADYKDAQWTYGKSTEVSGNFNKEIKVSQKWRIL